MFQFLIIATHFSLFTKSWELFGFSEYGFSLTDFLVCLCFLYFLKYTIWDGKPLIIPKSANVYSLLIFILALCLSSILPILNGNSEELGQLTRSVIHIFFLMFFTFFSFTIPQKEEWWVNMLKMWLYVSIFINIFGAYQMVARAYDLPFAWISVSNSSFYRGSGSESHDEFRGISLQFENYFRATSIFSEPSALAGFNAFIFVLTGLPYLRKVKSFLVSPKLNLFIFIWSIIALLLAFSLTGVVSILLVVIGFFIIENKVNIKNILFFLCGIVLLFLTVDLIVESYANISILDLFYRRIVSVGSMGNANVEGISGESTYTRAEGFKLYFDLWKENPILGIGAGLSRFAKSVEAYYGPSTVMHALGEEGILGCLSIIFLLFSNLFLTLKYLKNKIQINYSENLNNLLKFSVYFMLLQITINFISGTAIGNEVLWHYIAIVFAIVSIVHILNKKEVIEVKFLRIPIKYYFKLFIVK